MHQVVGSDLIKVPSAERGTLRAYQDVWTEFSTYCKANEKKRERVEEQDVANFIADKFKKGASGSRIGAMITALDMTKKFLVGSDP